MPRKIKIARNRKINEIKPNNSTNGVEFDLTNTFFSSVKKGT